MPLVFAVEVEGLIDRMTDLSTITACATSASMQIIIQSDCESAHRSRHTSCGFQKAHEDVQTGLSRVRMCIDRSPYRADSFLCYFVFRIPYVKLFGACQCRPMRSSRLTLHSLRNELTFFDVTSSDSARNFAILILVDSEL